MRSLALSILLLPSVAQAMPWWTEEDRAPELGEALGQLWPGHDVDVLVGQPADGDGIWWSEGELFFRVHGQLRSDRVRAQDLTTQILLARSWAGSVEVLDGGWLPPEVRTETRLERARPLAPFLRMEIGATTDRTPSVSLGTGLAFSRVRAGVRLTTDLAMQPSLALDSQISAWLPAGRSALELGAGPGLTRHTDGWRPAAGAQLTVWAPDLDGHRVGVGLSARVSALPQLKDAFALRAEVSWSFGPNR